MSAADVAAVARARRGPSTAWWGMAMFIATESTLFAMMIGSYFYLRFKNLQWPPAGTPEPKAQEDADADVDVVSTEQREVDGAVGVRLRPELRQIRGVFE